MRVFADRRAAGRALAERLRALPLIRSADHVVVLAVPRGGVPVGMEVAQALAAPLDVIVVRKVRSPHNTEIGVGAVGPDGHVTLDADALERLDLEAADLESEIQDRRDLVARRLALYREAVAPATVSGVVAVVVDDGVATGGTLRQAAEAVARMGPGSMVLAVPVGPADTTERLADVADEVVVLSSPAELMSVSQGYEDFGPLDDTTVVRLLREVAGESHEPAG